MPGTAASCSEGQALCLNLLLLLLLAQRLLWELLDAPAAA
jgi:hypothetical protein